MEVVSVDVLHKLNIVLNSVLLVDSGDANSNYATTPVASTRPYSVQGTPHFTDIQNGSSNDEHWRHTTEMRIGKLNK